MPPPNMAGRRSSFAGSSDERADTKNRRASRSSRDRASRDGIEVIPESEDPAAQKRAADLKAKRRSDAMKNMGGGGLSEMMADMSANLVHGLDENATPNAKMQRVMIAAKERGLTVQQASAARAQRNGRSRGANDGASLASRPGAFSLPLSLSSCRASRFVLRACRTDLLVLH